MNRNNNKNWKNWKNRKGIIFTIVALLFTILLTAIYSNTIIRYNPYSNRPTFTRIKVMDNYVKNFESYVDDSLKISTYNTLNSLYAYASTSGPFISPFVFGQAFNNCMKCGYMDCASPTTPCPGLSGRDLGSMLQNITNLSRKHLNIITVYNINSVNITQTYPFDVNAEASITYAVYDIEKDNYAVWNRTTIFTQTVSIIGLYDPLVSMNTGNVFKKRIIPTSICAYNESCWNESSVRQFYNSQEYRYYGNATSYLNRFLNSSARSSCCGIESLLNTTIASGFNSYLDRLYWNGSFVCTPSSTDKAILEINNTAPGFRLDEETAARYRLTSYGYKVCP